MINSILQYYTGGAYRNDRLQQHPSLFGGRSGSAMVLFLLYKALDDTNALKALHADLEDIADQCANADAHLPGFSNGLAGVGWLFAFMSRAGIISVNDDDFLPDIDTLLASGLHNLLQRKEYSLMHGATGLGLYFLRRRNLRLIGDIINSIEKNSIAAESGICWITNHSDEMSLNESYDLGLTHGHAGVLYFLGKCYQENILKDRCRKLIEGGIDFLLHHEQSFLQVGSFFPNTVVKRRQTNIIYPHKSRLAWCYGDLTILYTLLTLSQQLGRTELTGKCISMIMTTSQRTDPGNNEVNDGFFCHGASGVGYVYKKIARLINNRSIYETSEYWRQLCMKFEKNKFTTGTHKSGLLEGLGGVALFLIDHAHNSTGTDWDECIFLS